ncbi:hypothetical protein [Desulfocurvus sp.]|jgi:hypothetical protein|uniref:hypothetical protein n=1 Tax=Desulfocurvus sp. TaxID=2871698 RepID=UPI0025C22AEA|nr:hypothetical protein [Desulfocurvus sp.]MCK9240766.1 hypothetical protein [Desulfocurvus sp.]
MRILDMEPSPEEIRATFEKLRASLRPEVLCELHSGGFREAMIEEYGALASAANDLLNLLRRNNFAAGLDEADAGAYEHILARLSTGAQRCRLIVEESASVDEQAMLAIAATPTRAVN